MNSSPEKGRVHERWAQLRFSIIGSLLSSPPPSGELAQRLGELAGQTWRHPISGEPAQFGVSTLERWYYQAKNDRTDPVGALRRKIRKDQGQQKALSDRQKQALHAQYGAHPNWSMQLHSDNLGALVAEDATLGGAVSYSTVMRFLKSQGLLKRRRLGPANRPGAVRAEERRENREVRSYEAEYVNGLWHLDFHEGSRKVILPNGTWATPALLGVLDDRSRLAPHVQWYLAETAQHLIHGLCQGFQKRGLPRGLLNDNGSAMLAAETQAGLQRLSIVADTTLPYSPYQNAKQEVFWAQVEGRLLAMLEGETQLTLSLLNQATQAWVEMEYHRKVHSETGQTPLARYLAGPDVGRPCPSSETLRRAFLREEQRTQRRSDGTLSLEGIRFEVPGRYRHLQTLTLRYASFDLTRVFLVDGITGNILCPLDPLDRLKNADGRRRTLDPPGTATRPAESPPAGMAPLLKQLMARYAATGLPPAYVPLSTGDSEHSEKEPQ